jgi:hypothetical protein
LLLAEKKDACYSKVRSRYKVWPSAYASGALVQCRKKGAANWGNKNESADDNFGKSAALMTASPEALKTAQDIVQKQADKNVISQAKIAGAVPDQGVAEGSNDTIYPNAEVIKSKNGKPVGEIYQDGNSWGAFHYRADRGYDFIDSREEAIEALKDLHQETGRSRPDYTIKGVAEGSETEGTATLAKIAAAGDNGYDMIEDGLNGLLGTEAQIMLQDMYDDVSIEHRLHPDDDFEQIYDRMMDRIESDYGQQGMAEGDNEKIAGRHDPEEFDAMMGRLRQLAGSGPLKTVWDEKKRVYRNVPTAQQPNKGSQSNA